MIWILDQYFLKENIRIHEKWHILSICRAVGGDVVAVQLLDQNSWSAPAEVVLEDEGYDPGDTLESDKECLAKALKSKDKQPTGINA